VVFCLEIDRRNNYIVPKVRIHVVKNYVQIWLRYLTLKFCLGNSTYWEFVTLKCIFRNWLAYGIIMYSHLYYII
jgi:hypothetical protein